MTNHDWDYQKKCEGMAEELWEEAIGLVKGGQSTQYFSDRLSEAADNAVPIYTNELYRLVEYLDEYWDDVHADAKTLDDALRYSAYMKASDYIHQKFNELGGEEMIEEMEECWEQWKDALEDPSRCKMLALEELSNDYPDASKHLKFDELKKQVVEEQEKLTPRPKMKM